MPHLNDRFGHSISGMFYAAHSMWGEFDLRDQKPMVLGAQKWATASSLNPVLSAKQDLFWDTNSRTKLTTDTQHAVDMHVYGASLQPQRCLPLSHCRYAAHLAERVMDVRMKMEVRGIIEHAATDTMISSPFPGLYDINFDIIRQNDKFLQSAYGQMMQSPMVQQNIQCLQKAKGSTHSKVSTTCGMLYMLPKERKDTAPVMHTDFVSPNCM